MPIMKMGLVSISFRNKSAEQIIGLCRKNNIGAIEWGSDVHAHNEDCAKEIERMSQDSGIQCVSLGSYYRCEESQGFMEMARRAAFLKAPLIRIWAGARPSKECASEYKGLIARNAAAAAKIASDMGIATAFEYHESTLTDSPEEALALVEAVKQHGAQIFLYWQPPNSLAAAERQETLQKILPHLAYAHVFYWRHDAGANANTRLPLADGAEEWLGYLRTMQNAPLPAPLRERYALLEFFKGDRSSQFAQDAETLRQLLLKSSS